MKARDGLSVKPNFRVVQEKNKYIYIYYLQRSIAVPQSKKISILRVSRSAPSRSPPAKWLVVIREIVILHDEDLNYKRKKRCVDGHGDLEFSGTRKRMGIAVRGVAYLERSMKQLARGWGRRSRMSPMRSSKWLWAVWEHSSDHTCVTVEVHGISRDEINAYLQQQYRAALCVFIVSSVVVVVMVLRLGLLQEFTDWDRDKMRNACRVFAFITESLTFRHVSRHPNKGLVLVVVQQEYVLLLLYMQTTRQNTE